MQGVSIFLTFSKVILLILSAKICYEITFFPLDMNAFQNDGMGDVELHHIYIVYTEFILVRLCRKLFSLYRNTLETIPGTSQY